MDARLPQSKSFPSSRRPWLPALLLAGGLVGLLAGCSLFIYANKMFFGDPVVECGFTRTTGVDLMNGDKSVIVLCTVPTAVSNDYSALHMEILERVTLRLKTQHIKVVLADKVLTWLDDNGGRINDRDELAAKFKADYIIHIDLTEFTHRAENSPQLYQGKAHGEVRAYAIKKEDGQTTTEEVFKSEIQSLYPEHNPIPANRMSADLFRGEYLDRISTQIAQLFHNYPASETVY